MSRGRLARGGGEPGVLDVAAHVPDACLTPLLCRTCVVLEPEHLGEKAREPHLERVWGVAIEEAGTRRAAELEPLLRLLDKRPERRRERAVVARRNKHRRA